ncbi:hypothetical protein LG331_08085 [Vreelandella aquamarina]|uniref:hypothetical protein n=1 Tax=Vreelandella aquamarina TaxID=77097 RepID=UPI00384CCAE2
MKLKNDSGKRDLLKIYDLPELDLRHHSEGSVATVLVNSPQHLKTIHGCTIEVDAEIGLAYLKKTSKPTVSRGQGAAGIADETKPQRPTPHSEQDHMSAQDRYIDSRLSGIESKLDAQVDGIRESVARMQKGFDDAEKRFERAFERHDAELALQRQKNDQSYQNLYDLVDSNKKHASNMAAVTIFGTIGGVLAALALVVTLGAGWISEQGSYAKSYGDTQVEIQRATEERAEFREAVQAIQATQQSILERLPPSESE